MLFYNYQIAPLFNKADPGMHCIHFICKLHLVGAAVEASRALKGVIKQIQTILYNCGSCASSFWLFVTGYPGVVSGLQAVGNYQVAEIMEWQKYTVHQYLYLLVSE